MAFSEMNRPSGTVIYTRQLNIFLVLCLLSLSRHFTSIVNNDYHQISRS